MGTFVFSKSNKSALEPVSFEIVGLEKDLSDDSGFDVTLNDGFQDYSIITDQGSSVQTQVKAGKNIVKIDYPNFISSKRQFFKLPFLPNQINVPLIGNLKSGELAVVLTFIQGKHIDGDKLARQKLDLKVQF